MNSENFLKTEYAQQLIRDADLIETELGQFNDRWGNFWKRNEGDLGTILIGHLVVEFYVDDWLEAANPGTKPVKDTRMSFSQKLTLIDGADPTIQWLQPGLVRLNRIRNQIAHNLEADLTESDLAPLREIVWPWHQAAGRPRNQGTALVKDFALLASSMLNSQANAIRRYGDGLGLVAYQKWINAAMKSRSTGSI
jgi:hypothetical protein